MNHLAHAILAGTDDPDFALGSAMGDFVHGRPDPAWPIAQRAGLRFHRAIDHYTDAHAEVAAARALFRPPMRRYAGIALDVWFDHLLVHTWNRHFDEPLPAFSHRWLALLDAHTAELPQQLRTFLHWMHAHDLPSAYGDETTLDVVFHAMATRLSRPSPLGDALPALRDHADAVSRHFDAFFPDLASYARTLRPELLA